MKITRIVFITVMAIAGFIGLFVIYFAGQVSAVYDPLKTYSYTLTRDELRDRLIQILNQQQSFTFNLTDSTGTEKDDLNYYADIVIRSETADYEFNIKYYKESNFWDDKIKSELDLIGAFDKINKTGGYKPDDTDIEKLIDIFEKEVINQLVEKNTSR